jgi:ABC-type bacteriocin/lantibiotic exporter with double-glycine peptidase domain
MIFAFATFAQDEPALPAVGAEIVRQANGANNMNCGQNCIYMLLKLKGRSVDFAKTSCLVPSGSDGMSLAEVRNAIVALGLSVEIRQLALTDLSKPGVIPLIILLNDSNNHHGHYVIVTNVHNDGVTVLDGTSGLPEDIGVNDLEEMWKGYALVPNRGTAWIICSICAGLGLIVGGISALGFFKRRTRRLRGA